MRDTADSEREPFLTKNTGITIGGAIAIMSAMLYASAQFSDLANAVDRLEERQVEQGIDFNEAIAELRSAAADRFTRKDMVWFIELCRAKGIELPGLPGT